MRWFVLFALLAAGCTTPCHRALDSACAPGGPCDDLPLAQRSRVHIYVLNGNDPFVTGGLSKLRDKLNQSGFAKVSFGGLFYYPSFESEIRTLHANDPDARFVIVGYGFGVLLADRLAMTLQRDNMNIDALIALAPRWFDLLSANGDGLRRIAIHDGLRLAPEGADTTFALASGGEVAGHEATAELILQVIAESANALPVDDTVWTASLTMIDNPAPLPMQKPVTAIAIPPAPKPPVRGTLTSSQIR